jgi:low affinity Fe/Cu permease
MSPRELFRKFARLTADAMGSPWTFCTAIVVVAVWGFLGPAYDYSDTWQLVINTATTIVTFLMVFVIQNTQNRDAKAIHLKLDELLRGVKGARTGLVHLEELTEEELSGLEREFHALRARTSRRLDRQTPDESEPTEGVRHV